MIKVKIKVSNKTEALSKTFSLDAITVSMTDKTLQELIDQVTTDFNGDYTELKVTAVLVA